jgi:hypothetical protein
MVAGRRTVLWRLTPVLLALLSACPQLLKDDFHFAADASAGRPERARDASLDPAGDAGKTGPPPALRNGADAGPAGSPAPLSAAQVALHAALVHRYRFDPEAPLLDSVGGANAVSVGATFSAGAAVLAGTETGPYIDLPNGLLAGLHNASFEIWVIWDVDDPTKSTSEWQRIFDLGRNPTSVEGQLCVRDAATALYLTPRTNGVSPPGTLQLKCETCGETAIQAPSLPVGVQVQLVAVVNDDANLLSLYREGRLLASQPFPGSISTITDCSARPAPCDWNNWLGRSQHAEDPPFQGRILDFRVYSAALDAPLIQASFAAGPDAVW